ncbi:hypothetical protein N0V85_007961 [Neurospora sp. IMI 360204]|nr:hypothetical protein N0V85_007961 [Neurospora sp. IMI 360204]
MLLAPYVKRFANDPHGEDQTKKTNVNNNGKRGNKEGNGNPEQNGGEADAAQQEAAAPNANQGEAIESQDAQDAQDELANHNNDEPNGDFNAAQELPQEDYDIADLADIDLTNYMSGIIDEAQIDQAVQDYYIAQQNAGVSNDNNNQVYHAANNQPNNNGAEDGGLGGASATYPAESRTGDKRKLTESNDFDDI